MPASTEMPDITVEIAFTTAPNDPSPVWVDVSTYVEAQSVITISRGRTDELSEVPPSKAAIVLDNRDGRFTPDLATSPYYPNVKKGRRIRVSATWPLSGSPVTYRRISGYVDAWELGWPDGTSAHSAVTVTLSSRLARLGRGTDLRSIIEEEYALDGRAAHYTMGEPAGSVAAGNVSGSAQPSLTFAGSGANPVFGGATGPGTDDLTAVSFSGGKWLSTTFSQPIVTAADSTYSVECFFSTSTAVEVALLRLDAGGGTGDPGATVVSISSSGILTVAADDAGPILSAGSVANGATHHVLVRNTISGGTMTGTVYLDGASIGTATRSATAFIPKTRLDVGGRSFTTLTGAVAHVSVRSGTSELSATRADAHSDAGLNGFSGERSDQRIARLAAYTGTPTAEIVTETGLSTSVVNQITNDQTALALMNDVVATEGGVLFDAGNGNLTFHARSHRYNASSALTLSAASQEIEADLTISLDDMGLLNDLTASRDSGVTVRVIDSTSVTDYGVYRESITLLTTIDNEVQDAANWKVGIGAQPAVRVPTAPADLLNCTSAQKTAILAREIGDRITLSGLPTHAPAASMDFFIEGYTERIGPELYEIEFNLSPANLSGVWQLDSTIYSVLGTTTRLGY